MPDATPNSHQPPEERFLAWVDALVDPAGAIPVPDSDLANLAGTAAFVQRTAGPGSAPSLSPDRTDSMWEEIMHAAPTAATLTPTLPAGTGARPIAPRPIPSAPAPGWRSYAATALLIAAIVAAGIVTAWRIAGPFDLVPGGDGPETAHQPGIAASATPAIATPATISAGGCPLTSDMPIFVGETPAGVDALGLTWASVKDGDLTIKCPGVEDPEPLLSGITNAMPLQWPGTVLLEFESGNALAYNIASGERIGFGDLASASASVASSPGSPWLLTPVGPDIHLTNLRTMRSTSLAIAAGGKLPNGYSPVVISSPDSSVAVITDSLALVNNDGTRPSDEMPGTALVIDETLETRHWIDATGQVAVDDGVIAYEARADGLPMIRIEDAKTGEALFDAGPIDSDGSRGRALAFAGDGETLVYLHAGQIWLAPYRTMGTANPPMRSVEGPMPPAAVYPTGVPGRMLVEWNSDENIGGPGIAGAKSVSILDVATGELTDVDGLLPIDPELTGQFASVRYLVTVDSPSDSDEQTIARMIDIATGETVVTSAPIDASVPELIEANNVFSSSGTGAIATVSAPDGISVLLNATLGTSSQISTDALPNTSDSGKLAWHITPSHDGAWLFAIGLPQPEGAGGLDIASPDAIPGMFAIAQIFDEPKWSEPMSSLPAGTILGIPPNHTSDEPAVLEAQEFPSPAASPTGPVAVTGCDLTGDIPVVTDLDAAPGDGTALLLQDGTLSLTCDSGTTVVVAGVTEVVPLTTWPGAVLLHMDDGSLRGVNLLTGAEGDLGAFPTDFIGAGPLVTRWIFFPTSPEQLDWRIIDLETMDSLLLSEEIGGVLPRSTVAHLWATTPDAAVIGFGGTPIIPGQVPSGPFDRGGATPPPGTPTAELPAEWSALVFDGSLDNRRLIETSRSMQTTAAISPDGELLAYSRPAGDGFTVRVERLSDGGLVADTGIELGGPDAFLLLDTGVLHLTPDRLDRVTWSDAGAVAVDTLITFEAPPDVPVLVQTTGPNVAIVGATGPSGESVGYLVDAASGEVTEVPGMLQMPFYLAQYNDGAPVGYVLAAAPTSDPDQSAVQLIEIATGEPVATSEPLDVASQELATSPAALRGDRGFVFLPDGRIVVVDAERGEASMIEPPGDLKPSYLMPSPGGDALAVAAGKLFVRAVEPGAQWIEVTVDTFITFVPGAGALFDVP